MLQSYGHPTLKHKKNAATQKILPGICCPVKGFVTYAYLTEFSPSKFLHSMPYNPSIDATRTEGVGKMEDILGMAEADKAVFLFQLADWDPFKKLKVPRSHCSFLHFTMLPRAGLQVGVDKVATQKYCEPRKVDVCDLCGPRPFWPQHFAFSGFFFLGLTPGLLFAMGLVDFLQSPTMFFCGHYYIDSLLSSCFFHPSTPRGLQPLS